MDEVKEREIEIAAVQLWSSTAHTPDDNRAHALVMLDRAARQRPDLVVMPEAVSMLCYPDGRPGFSYRDVAEPVPGPTTEHAARIATEHGVNVVLGLVAVVMAQQPSAVARADSDMFVAFGAAVVQAGVERGGGTERPFDAGARQPAEVAAEAAFDLPVARRPPLQRRHLVAAHLRHRPVGDQEIESLRGDLKRLPGLGPTQTNHWIVTERL